MSKQELQWKTEKRKIIDLIPYEHNPRMLTEKQSEQLKASLTKFNLVEIPVINTDNVLIAGHQRLSIMKLLGRGEETVDVRVPNRKLTTAELKEYNVRSNKNTGSWDFDILANNFNQDSLIEWGFETTDFLGKTSEAEEDSYSIPENINTKIALGDLIEIGEHRLMCGDSCDSSQMSKLMDGKKADMVFTDPPYGVSIGKKNRLLNSFQKAGRNLTDIVDDESTPEELKVILTKAFTNLKSNLNDCCAVFVTAPQGGGIGMMMMMMMEAGLEIKHVLIWLKNSPTFSMGRLDYDYKHEPILFTWTKTHKRKKQGDFQTSIWEADKPRANKEHPTMKPIALPANAILNHSDEGDIIADIYMGSGTTMVAAHQLKRKAYGMEISPTYCQVIIDRMLALDADLTVKINGKSFIPDA